MTCNDYIRAVDALRAPEALRMRVAALEQERRPAKRRHPARWWGLCACLAAALLGGGLFLSSGGLGGSSSPPGAGGGGHDGGNSVFLSYAGPVFPLSTLEGVEISASRELTLNFSPWTPQAESGEDGSGYQHWQPDALVTDAYVLSNHTDTDQTFTLVYPFAASFQTLSETTPLLTSGVDPIVNTSLRTGGSSGAADGAGSVQAAGRPEQFNSWEDYRALLQDGSHLAQALGDGPDLSAIPVTVYRFTGPWGPARSADIPNPTVRVSFSLDYSETAVLSYGFQGGYYDSEEGFMAQSFSIPGEYDISHDRTCYLLVLGEDISGMEIRGYATGGFDTQEQIDAGAAVERCEGTLDEVLREILSLSSRQITGVPGADQSDFELCYRALCEHLVTCGFLTGTPAERCDAGWLEEIISEVVNTNRVFYLTAPIAIPAGGSMAVEAHFTKAGSYDYACAHTENRGIYGYDMVSRLGSSLNFTGLSAKLRNTEAIQIVRQNMGFDLEQGIAQVTLDPDEEHYYLEIRRADTGESS